MLIAEAALQHTFLLEPPPPPRPPPPPCVLFFSPRSPMFCEADLGEAFTVGHLGMATLIRKRAGARLPSCRIAHRLSIPI